MKQIGEIRVVKFLKPTTLTASANGSAIDTNVADSLNFESALVVANIGSIAGDVAPTSVTVKFEESDSSTFATGNTVVKGGEETTVVADTMYTFQLQRTKRYLREVSTITGGTNPTAVVSISGVLNNWALPLTIV